MQQMANLSKKNVKILGVSILTSLDDIQTEKYYNSKNINDLICKFVKYAMEANKKNTSKGKSVVDGFGAKRVAKEILDLIH